jgi:hypothetical protein
MLLGAWCERDPSCRWLTDGKQHLNNCLVTGVQRTRAGRRLLWEVIVMRRVSVLAVAATVLLVACGNESGAGGEPSMTPTSSHSPSPDPTSPPPTPAPTDPPTLPADPVEQAKADLAAHLRVDPAQVTVVSTAEVTWRDGSLGCPEPGMFYTQALIPGIRTILEVAGKQYHYHSGGHRAPFRCENPQPPAGG